MEFLEIVKARYSCRAFKDCLIDEKDLDYILEAGRLAPSSLGLEPWFFMWCKMLRRSKKLHKLPIIKAMLSNVERLLSLLRAWILGNILRVS